MESAIQLYSQAGSEYGKRSSREGSSGHRSSFGSPPVSAMSQLSALGELFPAGPFQVPLPLRS